MEKNEIKKALYRQKPTAKLSMIRKSVAYYSTVLENSEVLQFEIPVSDMGDADLLLEMEGKLLIRWLVD
jgi:hypothetical protein